MSALFYIILLVVIGLVLFFAELVLLPGITIAAVGSFCSLCAASAWIFAEYGIACGFMGLLGILVLVAIMLIFFFRPKTWRKVSLKTELKDTIATPIEKLCSIGAQGVSTTRLSPMGKVEIEGEIYEAKTRGGYIDEGSNIKVIGYDNQNVVVEQINL